MVVPAGMSRLMSFSAQKSSLWRRPARPRVTMRSLSELSLRITNRFETFRT